MANWRDEALRLGVDQNRPDLLRVAGITPDYGGGQSYQSFQEQPQPDLASLARQQVQLRQQYNQPQIQQTEAQKPSIESRYKSIIDELTRTEKQQTDRESTRLAREYSSRGIPLESDVYQKALGQETGDIGQYFSGQRAQTDVSRQSELDQLNQVIAMLQSGNPDQSINEALNMYNNQIERNRLAQQAETQRQFDIEKMRYENPTDVAYKQAQTQKLLSEAQKVITGGVNTNKSKLTTVTSKALESLNKTLNNPKNKDNNPYDLANEWYKSVAPFYRVQGADFSKIKQVTDEIKAPTIQKSKKKNWWDPISNFFSP